MSKTIEAVYNRVATFQSFEIQVEAAPNEWVRDKRKSTKPVHDLINQFLADNKASAVFVSPPDIKLVAASAIGDTNKTRTYSCAVSVIYRPEELVVHEGIQQEADIDLSDVPEEHREFVQASIRKELKSNRPATKVKAKSTATRSGVQRGANQPNHQRNGRVNIPIAARPRPAFKRTGQ